MRFFHERIQEKRENLEREIEEMIKYKELYDIEYDFASEIDLEDFSVTAHTDISEWSWDRSFTYRVYTTENTESVSGLVNYLFDFGEEFADERGYKMDTNSTLKNNERFELVWKKNKMKFQIFVDTKASCKAVVVDTQIVNQYEYICKENLL